MPMSLDGGRGPRPFFLTAPWPYSYYIYIPGLVFIIIASRFLAIHCVSKPMAPSILVMSVRACRVLLGSLVSPNIRLDVALAHNLNPC